MSQEKTESKEIQEWFSNIGPIAELEYLPLLSEVDFNAYQQFEMRRLFEDIVDYDLTSPLAIFRDPEYAYDSKDHCYCCGYFEPNEYNKNRYGYCTKFGSDTNPKNVSCDVMILL